MLETFVAGVGAGNIVSILRHTTKFTLKYSNLSRSGRLHPVNALQTTTDPNKATFL